MRDSGSRVSAPAPAPSAPSPPAPPAGRRGAVRASSKLRREEILTAAAALFARRGFHGVSIDDIGSAVGMSGPGIYRHFPGKEAVLSQMLLDISQRLLDEGGRRASAALDAPAALARELRAESAGPDHRAEPGARQRA
jgi:AcrR family transcriptional regulator